MNITSSPETKKGNEQIRIKASTQMCQVVAIVAEDGWEYDQYDGRSDSPSLKRWAKISDGLQVRISMNGPLRLTAEEWYEFSKAIDDALEKTPGVF